MTDLKDRLDDLVAREGFAPLDAGTVIAPGRRALRRRRVTAVVGSAAAVVALALVAGVALRWVTQPAVEFGDPAGRRPADTTIPTEQAYADLVTSRQGDRYVSITGFGWPLAEMDPDDISKLDAESMCLPMLRAAAPEVPASAWRHSESWVDTFPSRATLPTVMEAEHSGRYYSATCALPGDDVPTRRPDLRRLPAETDEAAITEQCSYLGHLDLSGWRSTTYVASTGTAMIAALRSPTGELATCVLARTPAGRSVQLTRHPEPLAPDDAVVVHRVGRVVLAAGRAPARATSVELEVSGRVEGVGLGGSTFAVAIAGVGAGDPTVRLTFRDAADDELASFSSTTPGDAGALLPPDCFYSLETGNDGC